MQKKISIITIVFGVLLAIIIGIAVYMSSNGDGYAQDELDSAGKDLEIAILDIGGTDELKEGQDEPKQTGEDLENDVSDIGESEDDIYCPYPEPYLLFENDVIAAAERTNEMMMRIIKEGTNTIEDRDEAIKECIRYILSEGYEDYTIIYTYNSPRGYNVFLRAFNDNAFMHYVIIHSSLGTYSMQVGYFEEFIKEIKEYYDVMEH